MAAAAYERLLVASARFEHVAALVRVLVVLLLLGLPHREPRRIGCDVGGWQNLRAEHRRLQVGALAHLDTVHWTGELLRELLTRPGLFALTADKACWKREHEQQRGLRHDSRRYPSCTRDAASPSFSCLQGPTARSAAGCSHATASAACLERPSWRTASGCDSWC